MRAIKHFLPKKKKNGNFFCPFLPILPIFCPFALTGQAPCQRAWHYICNRVFYPCFCTFCPFCPIFWFATCEWNSFVLLLFPILPHFLAFVKPLQRKNFWSASGACRLRSFDLKIFPFTPQLCFDKKSQMCIFANKGNKSLPCFPLFSFYITFFAFLWGFRISFHICSFSSKESGFFAFLNAVAYHEKNPLSFSLHHEKLPFFRFFFFFGYLSCKNFRKTAHFPNSSFCSSADRHAIFLASSTVSGNRIAFYE